MCNINYPKFPYKTCAKNVHDKDKAVPKDKLKCDLYELWVHVKCSNLNYLDYRYLKNCNEYWYCIKCSQCFLSTPCQVTKSSWLVVLAPVVTSHCGKI